MNKPESTNTKPLFARVLTAVYPLRKYLLTIAATVGAIAVAASVLNLFAGTSGQYSSIIVLAVTNLVSITLIGILLFEYANQKRLVASHGRINAEVLNRTLSELNDVFSSRTSLSRYIVQHSLTGSSDLDVVEGTRRYIDHLLMRAKIIFDAQTRADCAVCVKLVSRETDNDGTAKFFVVESLRDASSAATRIDPNHPRYPALDNTAFAHIVGDGENIRYFYYNNDLFRSSIKSEYKNSNPYWFRRYNATAVCAIKDPDRTNPNDLVGFLCVDNMVGGFDAQTTCSTMKILSTSLFYVFSNLAIIKSQREDQLQPSGEPFAAGDLN